MKTSVTLQEPFSYSLLPILVVGALVIFYGIYLIVFIIMKKRHKKKPISQVTKKTNSVTDMKMIKTKYLTELETIEQKLWRKEITTREAYQKMSICIRQFVYEVTGIQVQNYTLHDIQQLHMPSLEALITEYYTPEFAVISLGDSAASLEKTKRAIELWN